MNNGNLSVQGVLQTFQNGLTGTGTLTVENNINLPGVAVSDGNYVQSGTTVQGAGSTLTVNGTFTAGPDANGGLGSVSASSGGAITATGVLTNVSSTGQLTGSYDLEGGTFFYNGASVQSIPSGSGVTLASGGLAGVKIDSGGNTVLLSADGGATSALNTLTLNQGSLSLGGGVTQHVASLTNGGFGNGGSVELSSQNVSNAGNTLDVVGNYEQQITNLYGSANTLAVGGNFSNDELLEVDAGSTVTVGGTFENLQSGTLQGVCSTTQTGFCGVASFTVGGTFNYGGGKANTVTAIGSGASVVLEGSSALMTPDGATNGFSALNTLNGSLTLENGAGVGAALASLTNTGTLELENAQGTQGSSLAITGNLVDSAAAAGASGTVELQNFAAQGAFGPGNTVTVGGNYAQVSTELLGSENAINVTGTFTNGGSVTVDVGSAVNVTGALTNVDGSGNLGVAGSGQSYDLEGGTFFYHGSNVVTNNSVIELNATGATGLGSESNGATILLSADGGKTSALDTLTTNNGTMDLEGGVTQKFASAVSNISGAELELTNAGNLAQTPGFTNSGAVEVDSGSELDVTGATGSFTNVASNTLSGEGTYVIGGTLAYAGDAINTLASGASLTLNSANWQINNNFGGTASDALVNFSDNEGTFDVANGAALSLSGGLTNAAGATMDVGAFESDGFVPSATSSLTVNGVLNNQGAFEAGNAQATPGDTNNGVGNVTTEGLTNGGSATFEVDPGSSFTVTDANGNSFTNLSAGTLSGGTYIIGGILQYSGGSSNTIQTIAPSTTVTLVNGYNITPDGTTNGIATLQTINGTLNVGNPSGTDFQTSFATIGAVANNGNLNVMGDNASMTVAGNLTNSPTGAVTVDNFGGASLTVNGDFDNNSGIVNVGASSDTGTITATGAFNNGGTLSLGNCQFGCGTPSVTVTAANGLNNTGALEGEGTIVANLTNGGIITPGAAATSSPGTLNITGNYTQTSAGTLSELIAGASSGQFSAINATGKVSLAGTLSVNALNGFTFVQGNSFDLFNFPAGDLTGAFATLQYGTASSASGTLSLGNGLELQLAYNNANGSVLLNVVASTAANVDNWINATDNWNNSANYATDWSTGALPTTSQGVTVGTGTGGTVTYNDANDTVASLTVQKGTSSNYTLTFGSGNVLTATNGVTINAGGEIDVETSGAALNTSTLTNNAGGTLALGGNGGGTATVTGISNTGTVDVNANGTLNLNGSGTYSNASGGTLAMAGGTITGQPGGEVLSNAGTITGHGTLSNLTLVSTGVISPAGTLTVSPSSFGYFENDGAVTVESGDTLAVTGSDGNTFVGGTGSASGGGVTVNGGTWTNSGFVQVGGRGGAGSVSIQDGGALSAASVDNSGTISTGNAGSDTGSNTLSVSGAFANNAGATFQVEGGKDSATVGSLSNAGTVSLASGASLTVASGGSYAQSGGATTVNGTLITPSFGLNGGLLTGAGTVEGNVSNTGGTLVPGDESGAGTFNIAGSYRQSSGGTLAIDIIGGGAGEFGVLNVTGAASLNGTLDIMLNNGFLPTDGETFEVLDASGGLNNTIFASITNGTFDTNVTWSLTYGTDTVTLQAKIGQTQVTPEPASLLLLGTGLLGLALALRRKIRLTA